MPVKITQIFPAITLILAFGSVKTAHAQAVLIDEGPSVLSGVCEPSIAIDPTRPGVVYGASILDNFYTSLDSGRTWQTERIKSSYGVWGDPCLVVDQDGRLYYFHLSDPDGKNWRSEHILDRMVCQTKDGPDQPFTDGSYTVVNGKKHDKEWAVVHPTNGTIGLSWTQFDRYGTSDTTCKSAILYCESTDGGESWSTPVVISERTGNCVDDDQTAEGAVPAFGINKARYVGWALDEKIYFSRSLDGQHWEDILVADQDDGWSQSYAGFNRANGMPITVVDHCPSSPYYGRIYLCWGDKDPVNGGEIWLSHSDNAGERWSMPSRVSPDGGSSDQFLPWIVVDPTSGYVYAVYYDRRDVEKENETNTFLAVSKDGGENWQEMKINDAPFFPSEAVFMGDYNHISAYGGMVRPIWTEMRGLKKSVWTYLYQEKP